MYRVTYILKHYVSEAGCAFVFSQEVHNLLDPSYRAILSYLVPLKLTSVDNLLRTELVSG
jgi:hypothetical protein